MENPEVLWGYLLSRVPDQIREGWEMLSSDEREAVYAHLQRMVSEDGWQEAQRKSAQAAINVLTEEQKGPDQ